MTAAFLVAGGGSVVSGAAQAHPAAAAAVAYPTVVAAGDIGCDPSDPNFSGSSPSFCQAKATAAEIKQIAPQYLLALGDTQYIDTSTPGVQPPLSSYQNSYDKTWGALDSNKGGPVPHANVHPVIGGAEYGGEVDDDDEPPFSNGSNYFTNFGPSGLNELPSTVTANTNDWYSFNVPISNGGHWHVVALDSECNNIGGCGSGSPEETWFRSDLAANAGVCTLVEMHSPLFTADGYYEESGAAQLWDDAVASHVVAFVDGHVHAYERFVPMDDNGNPNPGGTAEFIAGTGGESLYDGPGTPAALAASTFNSFGVLSLGLHASTLSYAFKTVSGATPDSGSLACNAKPAAAPAVSATSPVSGPSAGATTVTVTGTGFAAGDTVAFGTTPATNATVKSATTLTATAPAGTGTVDVTVTGPGGTSPVTTPDEYSYTSATNGYAVTLTASATTAATNAPITLTATSNQDIGPTPYGIWVYDVTTGALVAHLPSGTSSTTTVTQATTTTQRYVAYIANNGPTNIQAASTPAIATW